MLYARGHQDALKRVSLVVIAPVDDIHQIARERWFLSRNVAIRCHCRRGS